jgi:hypothetical protein
MILRPVTCLRALKPVPDQFELSDFALIGEVFPAGIEQQALELRLERLFQNGAGEFVSEEGKPSAATAEFATGGHPAVRHYSNCRS